MSPSLPSPQKGDAISHGVLIVLLRLAVDVYRERSKLTCLTFVGGALEYVGIGVNFRADRVRFLARESSKRSGLIFAHHLLEAC